MPVGLYRVHGVVGQSVFGGELLKPQFADVAHVADAVDASAHRRQPHAALTVFVDVANLVVAQFAVLRVVVVECLRVGSQPVGIEGHHAVGASGHDDAPARLPQHRQRAQERVLRQESPEPVTAVGLWLCQTKCARVHGDPYAPLRVAHDVEHFSGCNAGEVGCVVPVEPAVDAHPLMARSYPCVAVFVDAYGQHVVVHADADLRQRRGIAVEQIGALHEVASPHAAVAGLAQATEEIGVVGNVVPHGIEPSHAVRHGRDDTQSHVLLRHPDVARMVAKHAVEVVGAYRTGIAILGPVVRQLLGVGMIEPQSVAECRHPHVAVVVGHHLIRRSSALVEHRGRENAEGVSLLPFLVDIAQFHRLVAHIRVALIVGIHLTARQLHRALRDGLVRRVVFPCCAVGNHHQPFARHGQSPHAATAGHAHIRTGIFVQLSLRVGMHQVLVVGDEVHVSVHLGRAGRHGFLGQSAQLVARLHI